MLDLKDLKPTKRKTKPTRNMIDQWRRKRAEEIRKKRKEKDKKKE